MTPATFRTRTLRLAAASVVALAAMIPALLGVTLKAQAVTEIWQVVFAIPGISGLPTVPTPNPGFIFPSGVATVPATDTNGQALPLAGDIVVADTWNNMVRAFDSSTGAETLSLGSPTSSEFDQPAQVKVDANGRLIVSDTYHDVIKVFNADGTPDDLLTSVHGYPTNELTGFDWPKGIAMTPGTAIGDPTSTGRIAIVSAGNFTKTTSVIDVQVFNSMLQPLFSFGGTANANGQGLLHAPLAVAIDPTTNDFLVTDTATSSSPAQVLVYDPTGTFLFSFTNPSTDPTGPMNFPIDIVTEPGTGRVLVADAGTSVIYFFTVDYTNQTATEAFTISGNNTPIQFLSPGGLAFDASNRLVVSTGTYDSTYSYPDPTTQFVLVFDRPSLAIRSVAVTDNGVPVTGAVTPGTTLTFTVTLASSSGTVSSVSVDGTLTDLSGASVALGTQSPLGGNVTAGTDQTVTFSYQVPSNVTTAGTLSFTAHATGTVNSGTATSQSVTATYPSVSVAVQPAGGDTTAPTITATLNPASPQASPWYNTPIQITLSAADNTGGSGVKQIDYYYLGQQAVVDHGTAYFPDTVTASTAVTTINQDGTTTIYYRAVDNAGNASAYQSLTLQLDQTPPYVQKFQTSPAATGIQHFPAGGIRYWWNTNVSVAYTAQDALSGLKSATPASPLTFTTEGVDQRQVVTLVDNANNTSASYNPQSYTSPAISIDKTAPVVSVSRTPTANANGWNNSAVTVTFTASDALSGFPAADATTHIDGGLQGSRVFTLSTEGRNQTVATQTFTDVAGNASAPATYSSPINIDTTAPLITATSYVNASGQTITPNASNWFNVPVTVKVTATDNLSGFAAADAVNGVAGSLQGQKTTTLGDGTNQSASLGLSDLAGNSASSSVSGINVDTVAPVVTSTSVIGTGTGAAVTANANGWYNVPISVIFNASDTLSGFPAADAVSGTAGGLTARRTIALAANGQGQSVTQSFTDLAGNVSSPATVANLNVDTVPPTLNVAVQPTQPSNYTDPGGNVWYPATVNVTFTATDALSGFANGTLTAISTVPVGDGANQVITRTFADQAGNAVSGSSPALYVDTLPPTITPTVTKNGSTETISFAVADTGSGIASCTVSVNGTVVQPTCDPYQATTADTGKVVTATATDNVGHQASTSPITISFAPPEAYNQFDPATQTVQVFGWDPTTQTSTGPFAPVSQTQQETTGTFCRDPHSGKWFGPFPTKWWQDQGDKGTVNVYRIQDAAGNVLTLVERVKAAGKEAHVEVLSFQYTLNGVDEPIIYPPDATKDFEWSLNKDGSLNQLNQTMTIGEGKDRVQVQAKYSDKKNQTTVRIKTPGPDQHVTLSGLVLLQMITNHDGGNLVIQGNGFQAVPGPTTDGDSSGDDGDDDNGGGGGDHHGSSSYGYIPNAGGDFGSGSGNGGSGGGATGGQSGSGNVGNGGSGNGNSNGNSGNGSGNSNSGNGTGNSNSGNASGNSSSSSATGNSNSGNASGNSSSSSASGNSSSSNGNGNSNSGNANGNSSSGNGNSSSNSGNANGNSSSSNGTGNSSSSNGNSSSSGDANSNGSSDGNSSQNNSQSQQGDHQNGDKGHHDGSKVDIKHGDAPGNWSATIGSGDSRVQIQASYNAQQNQTTLTIKSSGGTQTITRTGQVQPESAVDPDTGKLLIATGGSSGSSSNGSGNSGAGNGNSTGTANSSSGNSNGNGTSNAGGNGNGNGNSKTTGSGR